MIPEDELRQMYCGGEMTLSEISDVVGVSRSTIFSWMKVYKIKPRTVSESKLIGKIKPLKNDLEKMYLHNKMPIQEIADEIGVSDSTVYRWTQEFGIKCRTNSESQSGMHIGENNGNWKGGISFEPYCERFNNSFKESVRARDNYTCQLCGCTQESHGKKLSVHHIHYDKSNCWPDVIALCRSCNTKVNANRDFWEEYFENQLLERGLFCWSIT